MHVPSQGLAFREGCLACLGKNGPSPWSRAASCSYPDRFVHLMSAWGLCDRQLPSQRRAGQCMSFYLQKQHVLNFQPCVLVE